MKHENPKTNSVKPNNNLNINWKTQRYVQSEAKP